METVSNILAFREAMNIHRIDMLRIALVPTMGALHAGHEALIRQAKQECDVVVVSIFVNPTQFGPTEDYARYPRELASDQLLCERARADIIFQPSVSEIYPRGNASWVEVNGTLTEIACGATRPGHFRGVTTVCCKLFHIINPDRAYFGEKDYQQLQVIKRMVKDLFLPVQIVGVATVREADGLAMSSRNSYLSPSERQAARLLPRLGNLAQKMVEYGELSVEKIIAEITSTVAAQPYAQLEYAIIVEPETLQPIRLLVNESRLLLAVKIGNTRLIDNVPLIAKASSPINRAG